MSAIQVKIYKTKEAAKNKVAYIIPANSVAEAKKIKEQETKNLQPGGSIIICILDKSLIRNN